MALSGINGLNGPDGPLRNLADGETLGVEIQDNTSIFTIYGKSATGELVEKERVQYIDSDNDGTADDMITETKEYDEKGNLVKHTVSHDYGMDGSFELVETSEYHNENKWTYTTNFSDFGGLNEIDIVEFENNKIISKSVDYDKDGIIDEYK